MTAASAISAMVFDLDGTIVDTESAEYEAIRRVWQQHGLDFPLERWSEVVGVAWSPSWADELRDGVGPHLVEAELRATKRRHHAELVEGLGVRAGVAELIAAAAAARIPLGIASNSDSAWVEARLEQLGLIEQFAAVVTIDRVRDGKPHPEPFLAVCRALDAPPRRAVALEDSTTGVASAVAAGLFTVACTGPLTANHDVSSADLVVASLAELSLARLEAGVRARHR